MATDFTVILRQIHHFGDQPSVFNDIVSDSDFRFFDGPTAEFPFDCPNIDPGVTAVLMFQSHEVAKSQRNVFKINTVNVKGGLPASPGRDEWNGNIMILDSQHNLTATGNVLRVDSRNDSGGGGGNIDDFMIDNMIILYKTR